MYIPPIVVAVQAAFAEWGIPLQIAARNERNRYDFMAFCCSQRLPRIRSGYKRLFDPGGGDEEDEVI